MPRVFTVRKQRTLVRISHISVFAVRKQRSLPRIVHISVFGGRVGKSFLIEVHVQRCSTSRTPGAQWVCRLGGAGSRKAAFVRVYDALHQSECIEDERPLVAHCNVTLGEIFIPQRRRGGISEFRVVQTELRSNLNRNRMKSSCSTIRARRPNSTSTSIRIHYDEGWKYGLTVRICGSNGKNSPD